MTGDAQAEAEAMVDELVKDAGYLANMVAVDRQGAFPDSDELRAEVAERSRAGNERYDRMVAALTAAIEWRRAVHRSDEMAQAGAMPAWEQAEIEAAEAAVRFDQALSALREPHDTEGD